MDYEKVLLKYKEALEIKDLQDSIDMDGITQLEHYFEVLDLLVKVPVYVQGANGKLIKSTRNINAQPGLRFSQVKSLVRSMQLYSDEKVVSQEDISFFNKSLLSEAKGRLIEEWVLLETRKALSDSYIVGTYEFEFGSLICLFITLKQTLVAFMKSNIQICLILIQLRIWIRVLSVMSLAFILVK